MLAATATAARPQARVSITHTTLQLANRLGGFALHTAEPNKPSPQHLSHQVASRHRIPNTPYAQAAHAAGALCAYLGESSLGGTARVMHAVLLHTMHMLMQLSCMLKAHVGRTRCNAAWVHCFHHNGAGHTTNLSSMTHCISASFIVQN